MDVERLALNEKDDSGELHKNVFLTPKGMIKFVQLAVVICALVMTTSAEGEHLVFSLTSISPRL